MVLKGIAECLIPVIYNVNFRQARIYYFRDKCVVFASNYKFANLTQYNMQYIPWKSEVLARENTVFDPKKHFFVQRFPKSA